MTRKDFEIIAAVFAEAIADYTLIGRMDDVAGIEIAAARMGWKLAESNPRFDHAKFLTACGL